MSKERLEEIKEKYFMYENYTGKVIMYHHVLEWLIEQAERVQELETTVDFYQSALRDADRRVQELENHIDHLYDNNVHLKGDYRLQEQNKQYREALEKIKLNVNICGNEEYFPKVVEEIVNEALEGEE